MAYKLIGSCGSDTWEVGVFDDKAEAEALRKKNQKKANSLHKKRKFDHPNTTDPDMVLKLECATIYRLEEV